MPLLDVMRKKLREVQYFLRHMETVAGREFGDPEEFAFVLSAFLSASRIITDPLENRRFRTWFQAWRDDRRSRELELLDFMRVQRIAEVHRDGADVAWNSSFLLSTFSKGIMVIRRMAFNGLDHPTSTAPRLARSASTCTSLNSAGHKSRHTLRVAISWRFSAS